MPTRRRLLHFGSAAIVASVSGCLGDSTDSTDEPSDQSATANESGTENESSAANDSPTGADEDIELPDPDIDLSNMEFRYGYDRVEETVSIKFVGGMPLEAGQLTMAIEWDDGNQTTSGTWLELGDSFGGDAQLEPGDSVELDGGQASDSNGGIGTDCVLELFIESDEETQTVVGRMTGPEKPYGEAFDVQEERELGPTQPPAPLIEYEYRADPGELRITHAGGDMFTAGDVAIGGPSADGHEGNTWDQYTDRLDSDADVGPISSIFLGANRAGGNAIGDEYDITLEWSGEDRDDPVVINAATGIEEEPPEEG